MQISDKTIEEIADQLDCGMKCYLNKTSGAIIVTIPDEDLIDAKSEVSDDQIEQINGISYSHIAFEEMSSREAFDLMVDFTEGISDIPIQSSLINALNSKSHFRNFKSKIDDAEGLRQKWFTYKKKRYVEYVKSQIPAELLK